MRLTREQADFLAILVRHAGAPVHRSQLPLADRKQDRVRQSCRRLGLAEYVGGWRGKRREPMGWQITEAGRRALEDGGTRP
jgi:uncharacterized protein (DUF2336 family)